MRLVLVIENLDAPKGTRPDVLTVRQPISVRARTADGELLWERSERTTEEDDTRGEWRTG